MSSTASSRLNDERRALLKRAADRVGSKAALGRLLGYKDGAFVGQMLRGERPITEKTIQAMTDVRALRDLFAPVAISTEPPAPAPAPTPGWTGTLAQALEVLAQHLAADMPQDVREDAADLLAKLAKRHGSERDQQAVLQLLKSATQPAHTLSKPKISQIS